MAAAENPDRRARSQPASVCPARVNTPPGCAISGNMWPGWRKSSGRAFGATAVLTVCARSWAEMPVVTPSAASIDKREVGAMRGVGIAHHEGQTQLAAAFASQGEADEAAPVARHEIHILGPDTFGGHDQVALIFPILVVHDHRHFAAAQILENLIDRIERSHVSSQPSGFVMSRARYRATTSISILTSSPTRSSAQRRDRMRVRNDIDVESTAVDVVDGQAHAVD